MLRKINLFQFMYFGLFLLMIAMTPVVFAQSETSPLIPTEDLSTNSFLRFKNLRMNFRSRDNIDSVSTVLGNGSVIQLPKGVTIYNSDGSINFNETISHWTQKAYSDPSYLHYRPRYRNCPNGEEECPGVDTAEMYFPVKVVRASNSSTNIEGDNAYGYIALDFLKRNISPDRYQTVRTNLAQALTINNTSTQEEGAYQGDSEPDGVETTTANAGSSGAQTAGAAATTAAPSLADQTVFNCANGTTSYTRSSYQTTNCLTRQGLNIQQKAERIMQDVAIINSQRTSFRVDPRFSACISYRESGFAPNALGSGTDSGLYQVTTSTGREALNNVTPVTPGFGRFRNNYTEYRANMIRSTLAQADLHHSVLSIKARYANLSRVFNGSGNPSAAQYRQLAVNYNGSSRKQAYATAIMRCFSSMKRLFDSNGKALSTATTAKVQAALNQAK